MTKPLISVCIPYIRPQKAQRCINALKDDKSFQNFEIIAEEDKKRIGCPKKLKELVSKSNGEMVCFLGDDVIPYPGLLKYAVDTMDGFENGWGLVGFSDSFISGDEIATHWLGHKKLLDEVLDGEFFHTDYLHCYCDAEATTRCKEAGRYKYDPRAKIFHEHPIVQKRQDLVDKDYARVYSKEYDQHDKNLFLKRKANGWK